MSMSVSPRLKKIQKLEMEIYALSAKLAELRKASEGDSVRDYEFQDLTGRPKLSQLFGDRAVLFAIHNMGAGCRYCTLWADGFNGFLPHLEDKYAVVLLSKDTPEAQRRMANDRGWRFRMASHGGGDYIREQSVMAGEDNAPGLVCYVKEKKGRIVRKNATAFGPGDQFCSLWPILSMAGVGASDWIAQYHYWKRPKEMDDGGEGVE